MRADRRTATRTLDRFLLLLCVLQNGHGAGLLGFESRASWTHGHGRAVGPLPPKEMGVILGVDALFDAMLVRLILIPTLLRVFGHWTWARPRWLERLLPDVCFGHA